MTAATHAELVARAQGLIKEKENLEAQISALEGVLESRQNQQKVGMSEALVDADGFPRADIDVYTVRNTRTQIIRLRNDHKAKMAEIETALHAVHAQAKQESGLEGSRRSEDVPFAKVDGVDPEGPGAEAGIKRGDFIMRFGPVDATKQLKDIADVVNANENKPVRVLVKREEQIMTLIVTPHRWSGRGLLGCHLVPV